MRAPASLSDKLLEGRYKSAFRQALEAAKQEDPKAANTLGNLYYLGLGTHRDFRKAARWYLRSALKGYGPAQANLGHLYSQGLGVPKDLIQTLGWYKLAQRSGYGEIEDLLKRKMDENKFNQQMIAEANKLFTNLKTVKKNLSKELTAIANEKD